MIRHIFFSTLLAVAFLPITLRLLLSFALIAVLGVQPSKAQSAFSQHTRLTISGGYSLGKHAYAFYNPFYRTDDTSRLAYESNRGAAEISLEWSGFWLLNDRRGIYISTAPAFAGGIGKGELVDQDFCANGVELSLANASWTCPQQTSLWSESHSPTENWFISTVLNGTLGFFLSNPKNQARYLGMGATFGYAYHSENDKARGLAYSVYLPQNIRNSSPILEYANLTSIGNEVAWHYPLVGIEIWSELQPPSLLKRPITIKIAANYIPQALFKQEDSHFLRDDLATPPNIITNGTGEGFQLNGRVMLPIGSIKSTEMALLLSVRWQKLFLQSGDVLFINSDGSVSPLYEATEFTTENVTGLLGFAMQW